MKAVHARCASARFPRRPSLLWLGLLAMPALVANAGDPRDIAFDCPCRAEWTAGGPGQLGALTLTFGVRSFRTTDSGPLRLTANRSARSFALGGAAESEALAVRSVPAMAVLTGERYTLRVERPESGQPIAVWLFEQAGQRPASAVVGASFWYMHEILVLWPLAGQSGDRIRFVDILTDTDGDGVGDVNEAAAGTSPTNPESRPGESVIDLLALYNDGFRLALDGYPYTQLHHVTALTSAVYRDSGTNLRLRLIGAREIALDASGVADPERVSELLEEHGADLFIRFHMGGTEMGCPSGVGGCATIGSLFRRGYWWGDEIARSVCRGTHSALCAAHELGHNLGLVHSARQGEASGAFRWSRGHYVGDEWGTIMSYGRKVLGGVFSDPRADCNGTACGTPVDVPGGAHAVRSLDLVRFQVAARRAPKPDSDGDGIVDVADALPDDPSEWVDLDGDGIGDVADPDDDNDGVSDADDAFPFDASEWEDADQDGIGDNADEEVLDLSPFRDAALRSAVERALGMEPGAPIGPGDLETLETLAARRAGIRDLTGLETAVNLESVNLFNNEVADVSPLADLPRLSELRLERNRISDLAPLTRMAGLRHLWVNYNPVSDLSPLEELSQLESLFVGTSPGDEDHDFPDLSPLARLTNLRTLFAANVGLADLSFLSGLQELRWLRIPDNPAADLSPLRELRRLWSLDVSGTGVSDLLPLIEHRLGSLDVSRTRVTPKEVLALPGSRELLSLSMRDLGIDDLSWLAEFSRLQGLGLSHNRVRDLSALGDMSELLWVDLRYNELTDVGQLGGLPKLTEVSLDGNRISDVSPLARLSKVIHLGLSENEVSDIGPLARRSLWDLERGYPPALRLYDNPLNPASREKHIPMLESWGVSVYASESSVPNSGVQVPFADPVLRALVAQARAGAWTRVDDPITRESLDWLSHLYAFNAGVSDLAGLDAAGNLVYVFLGSNLVSDLTPLTALEELEGLDLGNNLVSDIGPLVKNPAIGEDDWITLTGNPLSEESLNVHVPELLERGVQVAVDSVRLLLSPDTRAATFDTTGYFEATLGRNARIALANDASGGLDAELVDGELRVSLSPTATPAATVKVTGTAGDGTTETLDFHLSLRQVVALLPSAARAAYHGFVRVINHSSKPGRVAIHAVDDRGRWYGPVTLTIGADATVHFNSEDLEHGNAAKGLSGGIGPGSGDWRLDLGSNLDIEALGYARTADGFVTALHDLVPRTGANHAVPFLNPGSNSAQVSRLRLVNHGDARAEVSVTGVDDQGRSPGGTVRFTLAAAAARTLTAAELETGEGVSGALGDGAGKWRLQVESPRSVWTMSLLGSPTGHLTNLSGGPVPVVSGAHLVPLFPAAADSAGRQGFVRVINREARGGTVTVTAVDDSGLHHGSVTLAVGAHAAAPFNSHDLEHGNADKGLTGGVGAGTGDWRLAVTADVAIDVFAYIRHADGFVTSMHDAAPEADTRHRIAILNPGSNRAQVSSLRLINPGDASARVTISGWDDHGTSPGGPVRLTVPARAARSYTAAQLEEGAPGLSGALGDGVGKWRLAVTSDRPISAMSLLTSPTGHLTNLSTAPLR